MTADRAALVEKVAETWDRKALERELAEAKDALVRIRADVLEEAARVIENNCHDDMTRAEEAAAIRARKGDSNDV